MSKSEYSKAIIENIMSKLYRNSDTKIKIVWSGESCPFYIYCNKKNGDHPFKVTSSEEILGEQCHRLSRTIFQAPTEWLVRQIADKIRNMPSTPVKELIAFVRGECNVSASYTQMWRARSSILSEVAKMSKVHCIEHMDAR
jgi:protoheme ferro-lyase